MTHRDLSRKRPIRRYVLGALVLALAALAFFVIRDVIALGREAPEFPSLTDAPDPSLHGTVAYFRVDTDPKTQPTGGCVRVIAAAGSPSRDVLCFAWGGDDTGPDLVFLPDGRLQVTMFTWPPDQPLVAVWQKIVDVRNGEIEETGESQLPAAPSGLGPTVTPAGDRISAQSRANRAELVLTDTAGDTRTLWSADVSPEYSMQPIWAPHWEWVLVYDGRLLLVGIDDPAIIRVLVANPEGLGGFGSTEPWLAIFAVTDADLLGSEA